MRRIRSYFTIKNQKGFTLVELIVALAITAAVGSALTMTISQIFSVSIASKNRMEAVKQVENALHYINRDAQSSGTIATTGADFPIVLTWNEWNEAENNLTGPQHQVTYSIIDNHLERQEIVDTDSSTMTIASNISDTSYCAYDGSVCTVSITAYIGGFKPVSETRTLEVQSRPNPLESTP